MWGSKNIHGCSAGCLTYNAQWGSEAPRQGPGRRKGVVAMGVGELCSNPDEYSGEWACLSERSLTGPVLPTS